MIKTKGIQIKIVDDTVTPVPDIGSEITFIRQRIENGYKITETLYIDEFGNLVIIKQKKIQL